jgi:hypothetical protein
MQVRITPELIMGAGFVIFSAVTVVMALVHNEHLTPQGRRGASNPDKNLRKR